MSKKTAPAIARRHAGSRVAIAMAALLGFLHPAPAADALLAPQAKLRITVVQWMPIKGAYEPWAALGGEFSVSEEGMLVLPVIGAVPVGTHDGAALAQEISRRLQEATGLVEKPYTTVEVVEYPPVYVVGEVTTPGSYPYRKGMTVLQALALGGGPYRSAETSGRDTIRLAGELRGLDNDILRTQARIARLGAEMAGAKEITFPASPGDMAGKALVEQISAQERTIFLARANELDRQTKSLNELRDLLKREISVLEQKIDAADAGIKSVETELAGVTLLVERGIATASRRSDLERILSSYRADRLDQMTAVMRARQGIAEATRNLDGLLDSRNTEVASELQGEQSRLEQALLKREVSQKLLLETLSSGTSGIEPPSESFAVIRRDGAETRETPAVQSTLLRPGDVIRVTLTPATQDVSGQPSVSESAAAARATQ